MPTRRPRSNKPKSVRLYKALRELNVAAETVVEHLQEKGFELDAKLTAGDPNAKLLPDMYDSLIEEYSDDAEAKARVRERREQLAAKEAAAEDEPDSVSVETIEEPEEEPEAPVAPAEPVIETPPVAEEEPVAPAEPVIATPEPEVEVAAPVAEMPAEEQPETIEPDSEAEPTPEPVAEVPSEPASVEAAEEPEAEEAPEPEAVAEEPEAVGEPAEADEDEPKSLDADENNPASDAEGVVRADRYELSGPKVLGKIDLSGLDSGRKRKRKKKAGASDAPAEGGSTRSKRGKKGKKGRPQVDQAEVEKNVAKTLQKTSGAGGGKRTRQKRRRARRDERAAQRELAEQLRQEQASVLRVMEFISTGDLAEAMRVNVAEVISKGFAMGMMFSINQRLDADQIVLLADDFGYEVEFMNEDEDVLDIVEEDDPDALESRSAVVTIMGHVDHGKTSLLDYIREANVVAGEAGGITQHIGAYEVTLKNERELTFLDTPGHEAFTAMRARGAQVTDLVILVVAADDRVMPQTIEAINHAQAAEVPIVVAINKIDREQANPDLIMSQLAEQGVQVEQYGGNVQCQFVSAIEGTGVDDLLEKVLIESDLLELEADPDRNAVAAVIESRLDKGRGVVATVLVQTGTLEIGDLFVCGQTYGRVRAMFNERDQRVEEAGPSTPVQILGMNDAPEVGDRLVVLDDERETREIAAKRQQLQREQTMHQRRHVTMDDLARRMALGELTTLNLVVKADVGGSAEALSDALLKISNDEVAIDIVHAGVGAVTESDVMLAAASDAIIIAFQVRPVAGVRTVAEREGIDIRTYSVIYDAIEEMRDALEGLLSPESKETVTSTIEVRETFRVPKVGTIAGCYVVEGKVSRNDRARLVRDGVVVYDGELDSLRRFKDDVSEVARGFECGLSIRNFNDIKVGDQIETYVVTEEKRTLEV
ncbi:MAG: translation initiation factor IF-2 [Bacteroidota bacterium]